MTVINTAEGRVKPGRYRDFLAQAQQSSKLYQRLGSPPPRLLTAGLAGEAFGTWTFTVEYESLDQYGDLTDQSMTDGEMQAFLLRLQDEDNPVTIDRVTLGVEIPVRDSTIRHGPIVMVNVVRATPGGMQRNLELGARASAFAERHGAVGTRMYDLVGAGLGVGMTMATWEFESMKGFAGAVNAFATDPEGQAIMVEAAAAEPAAVRVFDGVYTEIPL